MTINIQSIRDPENPGRVTIQLVDNERSITIKVVYEDEVAKTFIQGKSGYFEEVNDSLLDFSHEELKELGIDHQFKIPEILEREAELVIRMAVGEARRYSLINSIMSSLEWTRVDSLNQHIGEINPYSQWWEELQYIGSSRQETFVHKHGDTACEITFSAQYGKEASNPSPLDTLEVVIRIYADEDEERDDEGIKLGYAMGQISNTRDLMELINKTRDDAQENLQRLTSNLERLATSMGIDQHSG